MGRVLVVKTGNTLPALSARRGDYQDWILAGLGLEAGRAQVASVFAGDPLPEPDGLDGAVVTGSSAMVSGREAWSEQTAGWLARAVDSGLPVLGICYGHQLLAHALGGRVGPNPRGREIGSVEVQLLDAAADDPLLCGLPRRLRVQATHLESVLELPPAARRLAENAADPHHAFAVGPAAWGVQFHPEFDADVIREYLRARRPELAAEGIDADRRMAEAVDSADGTRLLRRFAQLLRGGRRG